MLKSRRQSLWEDEYLPNSTHVGLFLDRYLYAQEVTGVKDEGGSKAEFFKHAAKIGESSIYPEFFEAHRATLEALESDECEVKFWDVKIVGRVATGLGAARVLENGLAWHRAYGVPILPGSGLKGLATRVARDRLAPDRIVNNQAVPGEPRWAKAGEFYRAFFGATDEAGGIHFFDALPHSGQWKLVNDVLTPHHRDYYGGVADAAPADWDSPVPISFLSVEGTFQIALAGTPGAPDVAWNILRTGLKDEGFGAKTSSGYGRAQEVQRDA